MIVKFITFVVDLPGNGPGVKSVPRRRPGEVRSSFLPFIVEHLPGDSSGIKSARR